MFGCAGRDLDIYNSDGHPLKYSGYCQRCFIQVFSYLSLEILLVPQLLERFQCLRNLVRKKVLRDDFFLMLMLSFDYDKPFFKEVRSSRITKSIEYR
jgi:hypothetical protein